MANTMDIFSLQPSKIVAGIEGKCILIHSQERKLGKTAQACRMPKPLYLRFEQGANAIDNLMIAPLERWIDFKKVNKQLTDIRTVDQAKQMYSTIVFDTVDVAVQWCEDYICSTNGIQKLADLPYGQGYALMTKEWFREINKLANAGYTVIFIAHSKEKEKEDPVTHEKYMQLSPVGGAQADLILNLVDIIGYVRSNGIDEEGNEIPSSIYFANTREFQAGSRYKYLPKVVNPFTAENLQEAIKIAIEKDVEENGAKTITFEEKKELEKKERVPFAKLVEDIQTLGTTIAEAGHLDKITDIVEEVLGKDKKVTECTEKQYDAVMVIYEELTDFANESKLL